MYKNFYFVIALLLVLIFCDVPKENIDLSKLNDNLYDNSAFVYTSDEKYLAETFHTAKIDEASKDTIFTTSFLIYKTTKEFQRMYDFDRECDLENLAECHYDEIIHDYEHYILMRRIVIEESFANYYVSYGMMNSPFLGKLYFMETESDTTLVVEHYKTKLYFNVFNQSKVSYRDLYSSY